MKIDVKHTAKLANLTITPMEEKKFEKQLEETLSYIELLKEVNTDNVKITPQVTGLENILREDEASPSFTSEDATSQAQESHNGFFIVPAILEDKS